MEAKLVDENGQAFSRHQDLLEVVNSKVDAMVGHAVLELINKSRKGYLGHIVSSDLLGAVASPDLECQLAREPIYLLIALAPAFQVHFSAFGLEETGSQDFHGFGLILVLGALVLDGGDSAGGDVRNTNGAVSCIDMLASCTAGAIDFDAQIRFLDGDLDIGGLGHDGNGGGTGVNAALRFGGRDALNAMHARLELQLAEHALS